MFATFARLVHMLSMVARQISKYLSTHFTFFHNNHNSNNVCYPYAPHILSIPSILSYNRIANIVQIEHMPSMALVRADFDNVAVDTAVNLGPHGYYFGMHI